MKKYRKKQHKIAIVGKKITNFTIKNVLSNEQKYK